MGDIATSGSKGYGFSRVLVLNRVSILAILVSNSHSSLALCLFFIYKKLLFVIFEKTVNNPLQNACNIGLNWETNYRPGMKQGIDLRVRSYIGYRIFGQVITRVVKTPEFGKGFGMRAAHPPGCAGTLGIVLSTFDSHFPSVHGAGDIWSYPGSMLAFGNRHSSFK